MVLNLVADEVCMSACSCISIRGQSLTSNWSEKLNILGATDPTYEHLVKGTCVMGHFIIITTSAPRPLDQHHYSQHKETVESQTAIEAPACCDASIDDSCPCRINILQEKAVKVLPDQYFSQAYEMLITFFFIFLRFKAHSLFSLIKGKI